ncbi:MAG: glutaredoxin 3 [Kangiellaceae bacterium]|jgi:glutaredoxin 3|nr:glutaredoxin 3 [Kangiellaceae bacterium]|tara:strand:- start:3256 stop:3507 length:252 start_codon:yes stop_codon:yes gene_type:complete
MAEIVIYTTRYCPFCIMARRLLDTKQLKYQEITVDGNPELRKEMERLSGGYTVPQVFINDKPIGGYDRLSALEHQGELDKMVS